jgi:DNA topoisomerase-3
MAIERQDEDEDVKETQMVEFKWRRNHLFEMPMAVILYEQCVERPMATVIKVETKPTSKWSVLESIRYTAQLTVSTAQEAASPHDG